MPAKIEFADTSITITETDGSTKVFTIAPVVTDEKVVVAHSDGTTQEFDAVDPNAAAQA